MKIVSSRGRAIQAKKDHQRRLEEQFLISKQQLTEDEKRAVHRAFEEIRRQLAGIIMLEVRNAQRRC